MRKHRVNGVDLGARIREARERAGWTQQQIADHLGMSRATVIAMERGEKSLKPVEIIEVATLLDCQVSDLLQRNAPLSEALAVEAWRRGDLSEGQLAKALGTDRLGAREIVQRVEKSGVDGADPGEAT
jgi:transcriptional regulator with XRE-family HTH domain